MTDIVENIAESQIESDNNDLIVTGENEVLDVDSSTNIQNDSLDDDLCDILDSTTNHDTDILELSEPQKDLDAEKSNDSDDGDESPVERGKFISERTTESSGEGLNKIRSENLEVERIHGTKRKSNQGFFKRNNPYFNNRKVMNNEMRPRFPPQNRFRHPHENLRIRANQNFQQPMNSNMQYQQMQQMNPNVPLYTNNSHFANVQQYPVQQQLIINPAPAFHNPYIISQIQIPQQIPNVQSIITNPTNYGFASIPMAINNINMGQSYALQQSNIPTPIPSAAASNFNLTVTTGSNTNNIETRKVLINPHFKGRINMQRNIDDNELLRQQEEFINQNRRNLQKRMQTVPRYSDRDSPENDYRPPPKTRYSYSHYRKSPDPHYKKNLQTEAQKKSCAAVEEVVEDKETMEYRKRVEEQRKKRELFLKQKEERRKQRMQGDDAFVDSTVKESVEVLIEKQSDLQLNDAQHKDDNIHNRLNKPVMRKGVLNLRTGLIKPKSNYAQSEGTDISPRTSNTKIENTTKGTSDDDNAILHSTQNIESENKINNQESKCVTSATHLSSPDSKTSSVKNSTSVEAMDVDSGKEKSIIPTAGFLGRRLVIASNMTKHNIVVQAENKESDKKTVPNKPAGLFSNVVVNQEFSDDEDLSFLD